nr:anti-sigma factor [Thermoleophilaceae bacterium]
GQPGGGGAPAPGGQPGQPRVLGQIPLEALPGEEGEGRAVIAEQQGERAVVIQARGIEGVDEDELLEVWFYNSREEAKSIGAQRVQRGSFQGLGTLPPDWQRFRFIDVSRERADRNPRHSGSSVLRGETRAAQAGLPRGGP